MITNSTKFGDRLALQQAAVLFVLLGSAGLAQAQNVKNPLSWNGLTLYGKVDVGVSYNPTDSRRTTTLDPVATRFLTRTRRTHKHN